MNTNCTRSHVVVVEPGTKKYYQQPFEDEERSTVDVNDEFCVHNFTFLKEFWKLAEKHWDNIKVTVKAALKDLYVSIIWLLVNVVDLIFL